MYEITIAKNAFITFEMLQRLNHLLYLFPSIDTAHHAPTDKFWHMPKLNTFNLRLGTTTNAMALSKRLNIKVNWFQLQFSMIVVNIGII